MVNQRKIYGVTARDIVDFEDSAHGLLHNIWWEILRDLPIELGKEAMNKSLSLSKTVSADDPKKVYVEFLVSDSSPQLVAGIKAIAPEIIYISDE